VGCPDNNTTINHQSRMNSQDDNLPERDA